MNVILFTDLTAVYDFILVYVVMTALNFLLVPALITAIDFPLDPSSYREN
jgi:hypothetical protein